ncbi:MAG: C39 family peptidase [Deltaproteobacteria bacterium]|nr:C39 family peptidase [Deltaproteobacteria bacterium]
MAGCATNTAKRPTDDAKAVIANVPFIKQKPDYCGPASLAMIFNFYGLNVSQDEIAHEIFSPEIKGTLSLEMVSYAYKKGFEADIYNGSMADLRAKLEAGFPLIVSHKAEKNDKRVHYLVVFGFDDDKGVFYVHSDTKNVGAQAINYRKFLKHWDMANNLTFFIHPANKEGNRKTGGL